MKSGVSSVYSISLYFGNVSSLIALRAANHVKLNAIAFVEALVAFTLDSSVMYEYIASAVFRCDKSKAFTVVKPFHSTLCHVYCPLSLKAERHSKIKKP